MSKSIYLDKKLESKIKNSGVYERAIPFGLGKLMPITSCNVDNTGLIICLRESGSTEQINVMKTAEECVQIIENEDILPIIMLSFPNNENGLKSINSLRFWLDGIEQTIKEQIEVRNDV